MATLLYEHQELMWWFVATSLLVFVASLVMVPWLVVRIPDDYFVSTRRPKTQFAGRHPIWRWTGLAGKNLLGSGLILAGIAMLILPGQGLLTLAVGVLLLDFPGKHRLERAFIRMPKVLKPINWLRRKAHANPLRQLTAIRNTVDRGS